MRNIRLSEKHGVNPSITRCLFCGKDTGLALLGYLPGDKKAPDVIIADYEPCDECKANMELGITLIGVSETPIIKNMPTITHGQYPTGSYAVITKDAAHRFFPDSEIEKIVSQKKVFVNETIIQMLKNTHEGDNENA